MSSVSPSVRTISSNFVRTSSSTRSVDAVDFTVGFVFVFGVKNFANAFACFSLACRSLRFASNFFSASASFSALALAFSASLAALSASLSAFTFALAASSAAFTSALAFLSASLRSRSRRFSSSFARLSFSFASLASALSLSFSALIRALSALTFSLSAFAVAAALARAPPGAVVV